MTAIEKATKLQEELNTLRPLKPEDEQRIMQKFRLDWNFHSNHLEGNSLTYGETKALILFNITAQGKPLKDHIEITGHNEALKWLEEVVHQNRPLTEAFIRDLHKLILKEPYEVDAITTDGQPIKKRINIGVYKTQANHVKTRTGEIFRFASPEETPAKMTDLLTWYRTKLEDKSANPILTAIKFHYDFIRIHPFDDGNGRTARILMNFILMQYGFPPVIVKTQEKKQYLSALEQADAGIHQPFITFIAENLVQSLELMIRGANGESIEDADDLDKELALLEGELKGIGNPIEAIKNKENILNIYQQSIRPLYNSFLPKAEKFSKFYLQSNSLINISPKNKIHSQEIKTYNNALDKISVFINGSTVNISVEYEYKNFNQRGFEDLNFNSIIIFQFGQWKYSVHNYYQEKTGNIKVDKIQKYYTQQLTETEMNQLVDSEMKRHKAFIQQKIKEIKDKA